MTGNPAKAVYALTICLDDATKVTLGSDGSASVDLTGTRVSQREIKDGLVAFRADGLMLPIGHLRNAATGRLLEARFFDAVESAARRRLARARQAARKICREHPAGKDEI